MAALHSMAKTWKHPKCPTTEAWINKMWYTQTVEYYSVIKGNNAIGSNMEATSDYTKGSQTDKYHIVSLICSIKNMTHMHLSAKQTDS